MIDVHCHLNFNKFADDYDEVIKSAFDAGVTKIINVGTQISSSKKAVELSKQYDNLYAIVGVHPHHADKLTEGHPEHSKGPPSLIENSWDSSASPQNDNNDWLQQLESLAHNPKVIGVGECGIDYFSYISNGVVDPALQKKIFIEQIELSHKLKLPLQIHNRHAGADIIEILKSHRHLLQDPPGMFHCFAGDRDTLKSALKMGFYIGFDGNITYKGLAPGETVELKELATLTPLDRIVVETDSPFLTPIPYRGQRNEPKYAIIVARFIAELKQTSFEKLVEQIDKNVYTLFKRLEHS